MQPVATTRSASTTQRCTRTGVPRAVTPSSTRSSLAWPSWSIDARRRSSADPERVAAARPVRPGRDRDASTARREPSPQRLEERRARLGAGRIADDHGHRVARRPGSPLRRARRSSSSSSARQPACASDRRLDDAHGPRGERPTTRGRRPYGSSTRTATKATRCWRRMRVVRYDSPAVRSGHSCRSKACSWSTATLAACGCSRCRCARPGSPSRPAAVGPGRARQARARTRPT